LDNCNLHFQLSSGQLQLFETLSQIPKLALEALDHLAPVEKFTRSQENHANGYYLKAHSEIDREGASYQALDYFCKLFNSVSLSEKVIECTRLPFPSFSKVLCDRRD